MQLRITETVRDRLELIEPLVREGRILDVGCVDARSARHASSERVAAPDLLFRRLCELNSNVVGLDLDHDGVEELKRQGFDAICADACSVQLDERFDVIVAGEVIEHVANVGAFLENLRDHLAPDGVLIVSTPNPFYAGQAWKIWRYGAPDVHEDHVAWFDPITLGAALQRAGLEPVRAAWVQRKPQAKTWKSLLRGYFRHSFLVVARRGEAAANA